MGLFGGSSSSSGTVSNIISYSPNLTLGNDNKAKQATTLDQRASSEALAKDTMSASVGVGVGGGSGSGGAVSPTENNQRGVSPTMSGTTRKAINPFVNSNKNVYFIVGGVVVVGGVLAFILKSKKRK